MVERAGHPRGQLEHVAGQTPGGQSGLLQTLARKGDVAGRKVEQRDVAPPLRQIQRVPARPASHIQHPVAGLDIPVQIPAGDRKFIGVALQPLPLREHVPIVMLTDLFDYLVHALFLLSK